MAAQSVVTLLNWSLPTLYIEVVVVATDGAEAVDLAESIRPDVVLMDLKMPVMSGIQATRVLALTTDVADALVFDAIRSAADGYLLKDTPRDRLIAAIEDTAQGKMHVARWWRAGRSSRFRTHRLAPRQLSITCLSAS